MNRLVSGVRILMVGLPLKGYLPISTSKMLRTGRVLYTSDDVAKAVRLRSFNAKTATSERWGWASVICLREPDTYRDNGNRLFMGTAVARLGSRNRYQRREQHPQHRTQLPSPPRFSHPSKRSRRRHGKRLQHSPAR